MKTSVIKKIYEKRWGLDNSASTINRSHTWQILVEKIFQPLVQASDSVLDVGCGRGDFINLINAEKKVGLDADFTNKNWLSKDVKFVEANAKQMDNLSNSEFNIVFTSNFFEHLEQASDLLECLEEIHRVIKKSTNSKLIVMMPNMDLVKMKFYDFIDHTLPLNPKSLQEALELSGFKVTNICAKFIPYSAVGSKFTVPKLLIKAYLKLPSFFRFRAGQMLLIATPISN